MSTSEKIRSTPGQEPERGSWKIPFVACGAMGLVLGVPLTLFLASAGGLSLWAMTVCAATALAGLLGTSLVVKVSTGVDGFVFYRDAITAMIFVAVVLRLFHQPVLAYLDVMILGAGLFQACGRIGCLLVGCCHGRPSRWGVRYTVEHVRNGFPTYLVGVQLFPIQAIESAYVFSLVTTGTVLLLKSSIPGAVLGFYVLAYTCGRFLIELARGDVARSYFKSFSEAQWTSLLLAIAVVCAERFGLLPPSRWHWAFPVALAMAMLFLHARRRLDPSRTFEIVHPLHVREVAEALRQLTTQLTPNHDLAHGGNTSQPIFLIHTSAGLRLSVGEIVAGQRHVRYFSISRDSCPLSTLDAFRLANLMAHFLFATTPFELKAGIGGVFHVLFWSAPRKPQGPVYDSAGLQSSSSPFLLHMTNKS